MADEIENRHYTKEEEEVEKPDLKRQSHDDSDLPDSTSGVGRRYPTPPPGWILVLTPKLKTTERLSPAISMSGTTLASAVTINPKKAVTINPKKEIEERNRPLTEIEERNRPLTEDEFDALFLFIVQERDESEEITDGLLPFMKPKDYKFFGTLLKKEDEEEELSSYEQEERIIMKLLLELKNGTLHQMKTALRQLIVYAREVDAGPLFNQIFRLLMQPTLEEQEAHLLVKVISRIVYELDELVRPNVRKIIVVIRDLLMDEDNNVRAEGSEIIYNLSKAAGLATMIDAMRRDIDNIDEYVRIATTRSFVVVASALGIAALLPFMKEVCQSKKSWQAHHTGLMIVHEIIINNDHAVVPHLRFLEEIIKPGLKDEVLKVRTGATLALAALDKVAAQYGHCRDIPPMPFYAVAEPDILLRGFNI